MRRLFRNESVYFVLSGQAFLKNKSILVYTCVGKCKLISSGGIDEVRLFETQPRNSPL